MLRIVNDGDMEDRVQMPAASLGSLSDFILFKVLGPFYTVEEFLLNLDFAKQVHNSY